MSFLKEKIDKAVCNALSKKMIDPTFGFISFEYQRHNQRRLEHLASLGLDIRHKEVLELGAGIGDHTSFFLDRDCKVTITEPRLENLEILKLRFPGREILSFDLEVPGGLGDRQFDIVYCYGVLYHLCDPEKALRFMASHCRDLFLLETCVSYLDNGEINACSEDAAHVTQAISGRGCRPARSYLFNLLKELFPFVYVPKTQPAHEEFPMDWTQPSSPQGVHKLTRAIFIASRKELNNPLLLSQLPDKHVMA